ncbi:MAG: serine/threonine protein kinase [Deltaproteobacteria bacterium]|nr:serine/threonine protein kinase [Deltaproteobacteria bacterium]
MENGQFFSLTPERVLEAVEQSGHATTGLCYALNSLENRVYEVELEDRRRLVGKFYRPGRWSRETILDEHRLLAALVEAEIPVCAPTAFEDGGTLRTTPEGIFFALFPRTGGRCPDELPEGDLEQIGRLLGRIHNVSAHLVLRNRPDISPEVYGRKALAVIEERTQMPAGLRARYADAVKRLVEHGERRWQELTTFVVHGDCHRGNLLRGREGFFFLDFDDMGRGPAVQDFWLVLPARPVHCPADVDALLRGYEQFRPFDRRELRLIEVLRGLRYVRYAAWIAARWEDPSFPRAFPQFGTESYWEGQYVDLQEQLALLAEEEGWG